ncbi:hypothetical protein [Cerasicoccus frondis]|uniref:hypothetical protein n=1 Tax=Cerasicoccus frondis TaxID=490090 RepID=UPI0028527447|nr:hypothetical protein [Cerasicoccus frondis]
MKILKKAFGKYPVLLAALCVIFLLIWNWNENRKYEIEERCAFLVQQHQKIQETVQFNRDNIELTVIDAFVSTFVDNDFSTRDYAGEMENIERELGAISSEYKRREGKGILYLMLAGLFAVLSVVQYVMAARGQ